MRTANRQAGVTVAGYAGATGVLLAFDLESSLRERLIGFAIRRMNFALGKLDWLEGALDFPGTGKKPGDLRPTNEAPIQAFRWSDYAVYPNQRYRYEIFPVHLNNDLRYPVRDSRDLKLGEAVSIEVQTEPTDSGPHQIRFNRAAAASQAYAKKFQNADPRRNPRARRWLARGLDTHISQFIMKANDPSWTLDVAIYEFELPIIAEAVAEAAEKGARVRIIYHAKKGDDQTKENEKTLRNISGDNVTLIPREPKKIFHHKFIVLSRLREGKRVAEAVLTGSTNFTFNAVYYQANVAHAIWDRRLASAFLQLFEELARGSSPSQTRTFIDRTNPITGAPPLPIFSPRSNLTDLKHYIDIVKSAQRSLIFSTAFDLHDDLESALLDDGNGIVRYGLENTKSKITGYHRDKTAHFTATSLLTKGLEGFLKETLAGQRGRLLVHTKIILTDFDSPHPVVVVGSSNFSKASSESNDENAVVIRDATRVADTYLCEMMRLYTHYRFRFAVAEAAQRGRNAGARSRLELSTTDEWTKKYFEPNTLPMIERQQFSRPVGI